MFALNDTIVACATAPSARGTSLRAAIRISGPKTFDILLSSRSTPAPSITNRDKPSRGIQTTLLQLPTTLLPSLILTFPAPASYTGEDVAELLIPSNPHLIDALLSWLTSHDQVRLAQPGEFTARAFLRGKLTLDQAEGVGATIAAQSAGQLQAAKSLLAGHTGTEYRAWADELTHLLALVEAGIDFTDQEDVVPIAPDALERRIDALISQLEHHTGARNSREAHSESSLPLVALVGAPNAGKSTLFNALLRQTRTIASPTAGTTRDTIIERLDLSRDVPGAGEVLLADLPGLDTIALSTSDHAAQQSALATLERADLLIWCDPTGTFDERELAQSNMRQSDSAHSFEPSRSTILRIQTFGDKLYQPLVPPTGASRSVHHASTIPDSRSTVHPLHNAPLAIGGSSSPDTIQLCALDGWNLATLRRALADHATARYGEGVASLLPRHRRAINAAHSSLRLAREDLNTHARALTNPEALAEHLRASLAAIGELVGTISPDDVIGRVFATFCVGK